MSASVAEGVGDVKAEVVVATADPSASIRSSRTPSPDDGATSAMSLVSQMTSSPTSTPPATVTSSSELRVVSKPSLIVTGSAGTMQYLNPDYLSPTFVSLDTNNSPLAMLARTCNNIGKDQPLTTTSGTTSSLRPSAHHQRLSSQSHHQPQLPSSNIKSTSPTSFKKQNGRPSDGRNDYSVTSVLRQKSGTEDVNSSPASLSSSSASWTGRLPASENAVPCQETGSGYGVMPRSFVTRGNPIVKPTALISVGGPTNTSHQYAPAEPIPEVFRLTGNASHRPASSPFSKVSGGYEDAEDCVVDGSVNNDEDDDEPDVTTPPSPGESVALEQMMQRYAAEFRTSSELFRRDPVHQLLQHNREMTAFQAALATAAASYQPSAALGGFLPPNPMTSLGAPGRAPPLLPMADPGLYSAFAAAFAKQQQQMNRRSPCEMAPKEPHRSTTPPGTNCSGCESDHRHRHHQPRHPYNSCHQSGHQRRHQFSYDTDIAALLRPGLDAALAAGNSYANLLLQAAAAAGSGLPLSTAEMTSNSPSGQSSVCNWLTTSGEFCGRRFPSSDELLRHLQCHVTGHEPTASVGVDLYLQQQQQQLAAAAAAATLTAAGLFQQPPTLQSPYQSSLAAAAGVFPPSASALNSLASRVHPHHLAAPTQFGGLGASGRRSPRLASGKNASDVGLSAGSSSAMLLHAAAAVAASRYHPYKPTGSKLPVDFSSRATLRPVAPPNGPPMSMPSSLAAYLSSSPFGSGPSLIAAAQRLGPAVGP